MSQLFNAGLSFDSIGQTAFHVFLLINKGDIYVQNLK